MRKLFSLSVIVISVLLLSCTDNIKQEYKTLTADYEQLKLENEQLKQKNDEILSAQAMLQQAYDMLKTEQEQLLQVYLGLVSKSHTLEDAQRALMENLNSRIKLYDETLAHLTSLQSELDKLKAGAE